MIIVSRIDNSHKELAESKHTLEYVVNECNKIFNRTLFYRIRKNDLLHEYGSRTRICVGFWSLMR